MGARGRAGARAVVAVALGALCAVPAVASAASPAPGDVPDLALVVSDTGRSQTLRAGQPDFARLRELLQPAYTGTERVPDAWTHGRYPAVRFTVVWGLTGVGGWPQTRRAPGGDVAMERQDQLFVADDGTPWVRSDPAPDVADDDVRWHRAPRAAFRQAERRGLFGLPDSAPRAAPADGGRVPEEAWWAVPGLVAGAAGGLLIRRVARRRNTGPPREEPRQELIDL
ncbi:hypothetical protein AB0F77_09660 [Streptomyces sp. NPDC026672]|uniref:hypothetical protein n=1 Tax=unclassified Streptomyces TaxID=2593676 RepID=UPI0033DDEDBF